MGPWVPPGTAGPSHLPPNSWLRGARCAGDTVGPLHLATLHLGAAVPGITPCQPRARCSTVLQPCSPALFRAPFPAGSSSVITGEVGAGTGKPSVQLRPSKKPTDI